MTFTRLTLGEPFLQGIPRGDFPCENPLAILDPNTWYQFTFEDTYSVTGPPPASTNRHFPDWSGTGGAHWSFPADPEIDLPFAPFSMFIGNSDGLTLSTANPFTGTYHLRTAGTTVGGIVLGTVASLGSFVVCDSPQESGGFTVYRAQPTVARAVAGQIVTASAMHYWSASGGTPAWRFIIEGYPVDDTTTPWPTTWTSTQAFQSIGSGVYTLAQYSVTVPATSPGDFWISCQVVWRMTMGSGVSYIWDVDDVQVDVI